MSNLGLSAQNMAPVGTKRIGVYDGSGRRLGTVPLGRLAPPDRKRRLYSFELLSDIHLTRHDAANNAFAAAMKYAKENYDVVFVCITGDLSQTVEKSTAAFELFQSYFDYTDGIPQLNGKKVFAVSGNHEQASPDFSARNKVIAATGVGNVDDGLGNYVIAEYGDDAFFFLGCYEYNHSPVTDINGFTVPMSQLFPREDLVAIYEKAEEKRKEGKRLFFMQHVPIETECRDFDPTSIVGKYYLPLSVYRDAVVFYGHQHKGLHMGGLYRNDLGFQGMFVPALCGVLEAGQGYIVDVYPEGIHLRGMNFLTGKDIPKGTYWIDT